MSVSKLKGILNFKVRYARYTFKLYNIFPSYYRPSLEWSFAMYSALYASLSSGRGSNGRRPLTRRYACTLVCRHG